MSYLSQITEIPHILDQNEKNKNFIIIICKYNHQTNILYKTKLIEGWVGNAVIHL